MKYLKKYEGIFDIFKDQDNKRKVDKELLGEMILSDLDGLSFMGHEIIESILLKERSFRSDKKGHPLLSKDTWFDRKISYGTTPGGVYPFGSNGTQGVVLIIDDKIKMDIREKFEFIFKIYNGINYSRMNQYNIGYCLFKIYDYDSILFYAI